MNSYISPLGDPAAPIWVVLERPFGSDEQRSLLCSGGMGFAFQKMFKEAGIELKDVYFCSRRPDVKNPNSFSSLESIASAYKPPLVLVVGEAASAFLPDCRKQEKQETWKTQLNKYVGSLLRAPAFSWEHYCVPLIDPTDLMKDWRERDVSTYVDLGKIKDELEHFKAHRALRPLKERTLKSFEMDTEQILQELDNLRAYSALSEDIEVLYTKADSAYHTEYPGTILVFGIAPSPEYAISFCPFRPTVAESRAVWRAMERLHDGDPLVIGQNFFNFDSYYYSMVGLSLDRGRFSDTLIRHHVLWPELPHKLQFLTRQYTRQPYYKDEGKTWSAKRMDDLRHYNCLDAAVTFEVWEGQEQEFVQRPHLR